MTDRAYCRPRTNKDGTTSWQVRWREENSGKDRMPSRTFANKKDADTFLGEVRKRLGVVSETKDLMGDVMKPPGSVVPLLEDFIADMALNPDLKENSTTPKVMKYRLNKTFKEFGWTLTTSITPEGLKPLFSKYVKKKHWLRMVLQDVKRFVDWAKKDYAVDASVLQMSVGQPQTRRRIFWTEKQVLAIMTELSRDFPDRDCVTHKRSTELWRNNIRDMSLKRAYRVLYPMVRLLILWALRPVEACRLLVQDWDIETKKITVTSFNAKNGVLRSFTVDPETARIIDALCFDRPRDCHIFYSSQAVPWGPHNLSKRVKNVLDRLDIPGSLYCARHYACTRILKERRDIKATMDITGHLTLSEFNKYLHVYDVEQEAFANSSYANYLGVPQAIRDNAGPLPDQPSKPTSTPHFEEDWSDEDECAGGAVHVS